ncbi:protein-disulfide reductase DsbD family protein [soil metagenome]
MNALKLLRWCAVAVLSTSTFCMCAAAQPSTPGSAKEFLRAFTPSTPAALWESDHVSVRVTADRAALHAGDQFALAVTFEFAPEFHIWPSKPVLPPELREVTPIPTTIALAEGAAPAKGIVVHAAFIQWPQPQSVTVNFGPTPVKIEAYGEPATAFIPVTVDASAAPGKVTLPITVSFQACNASVCFRPMEATVQLELEIVASATPAALPAGAAGEATRALFTPFAPAVFAKIAAGEKPTGSTTGAGSPSPLRSEFDVFGWKFTVAADNYALILGIAFLAGLLMNFTPCVLPVIPLKILSIQNHAKSPTKLALFGTLYCVGIVTLYAVLGLLAFGLITGGKKFDWGQIFSLPWFVVLMSTIIAAMALGMLGLFSIRLPNAVYAINPTGESATGNFIGGVLTGILAVPCTGPLLGATLAWILTQPPAVGLGVFCIMGAGMAAPYALLIFFPKLLAKMPRGGPGSELLKQVMGMFMLAVAAFLASNLTTARWPWFVVGALCVGGFVWLAVGSVRMLRSRTARVVNLIVAVLGSAAVVAATLSLTAPPPIEWRNFENQPDTALQSAIDAEVARGNVVVVDFTAQWCTNCHVIEKTVIYADESLKALKRSGVLTFRVDLTSAGDEQGWGTVRSISGGGGIPLIAIFGPGSAKPTFFQSFFKPSDLVAAIDRAQGPKAALR